MALARRFMEARAKGDVDAVDEMLPPDFVSHATEEETGREGVIWAAAQVAEAVSNASVLVEDQVAANDKVVSCFIVHSTHDRGEIMGLAPSGREMTNRVILIHRISESKIAEEWGIGTIGSNLKGQLLEQERIERERIEQELEVARRIQQASLPKEVPELEGWEINPHYQPAREVGGDFYDFFELEEGRVRVVVGDATGKGVPAALVVTATCSMLRAVAQGSHSPGEVLARVNETLLTRIPANMFVTCFYAILDPKSGTLSYANAGHDLPYLHRTGGEAEELRATGMPLGLMPAMGYEENETVLKAGEVALFYSDGLVEAHNPEGEMFGFPRLQAFVAEHEEPSLGNFLLEKLYFFTGEGWEQEDDITLLTLRRSAGEFPTTLNTGS
ncbi:MAG: SpoIIE family protein phosphatase [Actinomycetota bacterium]|nr:SpoIIE family protein phosphatase [Actinomycetota bacterium]